MTMLRWSRRALLDLRDIQAFIAQDNADAAARTMASLQGAVARLTMFPQSGRAGRVDGTREVVVPGLPYIIVYRVQNGSVEIASVLHGARERT